MNTRNIFIVIGILLLLGAPLFGQEFYMYVDGKKHNYNVSPDKMLVHYCIPEIFPPEGEISYHINVAKYTIDADFLVFKHYDPDDGTCISENRYRYEFMQNQLKLIRDPIFIQGMSEIYVVNFMIFKKIN